MNLQWKRKISYFWPKKNSSRKLILLYHSVGNSPWGMPEKQFLEQIRWLCDHAHILPLTQLLHATSQEGLTISLTFDDGYQSLYDTVLPVLSEHNINATVYLNTDWISKEGEKRRLSDVSLGHYPQEAFLTWQEVHTLYQAGWEIGSHGMNHYNFTQVTDSTN